jgi:hypothetical protein
VHAGDDVLVYLREARDERVLVQISRADHAPVALGATTLDGEVGARLFGVDDVTRVGGTVELPAGGPAVHVWEVSS